MCRPAYLLSQARDDDLEVNRVKDAYFGDFGGQFIPETLIAAHHELAKAYDEAKSDPEFVKDLKWYREQYIGGPTPMHFCRRLTEKVKESELDALQLQLQPIH